MEMEYLRHKLDSVLGKDGSYVTNLSVKPSLKKFINPRTTVCNYVEEIEVVITVKISGGDLSNWTEGL